MGQTHVHKKIASITNGCMQRLIIFLNPGNDQLLQLILIARFDGEPTTAQSSLFTVQSFLAVNLAWNLLFLAADYVKFLNQFLKLLAPVVTVKLV